MAVGDNRASDAPITGCASHPMPSFEPSCLPFLHYDDCDPVPLSCNSISFFESPFLLPCSSPFIHTLIMSCGCGCSLYEKVWFLFLSSASGTTADPSSVSSEGVLLGRGHTRSNASASPKRLFPIDLGPMATCFQWLGRNHLKNGPSVGMQAAIRAK